MLAGVEFTVAKQGDWEVGESIRDEKLVRSENKPVMKTTQVLQGNENDTPLVWPLFQGDDRQIEVKIPDFPIQG